MTAVEILEAITELSQQPFEPAEFPYTFLAAFGNKETTLAKLKKGVSNASDIPGGVLQRNNIHICVAPTGGVGETLNALRKSPKTEQAKAKFILATDGETLEAEDMVSGETVATLFTEFAEHFGFFLPLAGISAVKEIKDNPIDVRATGRLNKLYVELLKENPDWATEAKRHDMNHFLARLIFCFFAEDTDIFVGSGRFTSTVDQVSERDGSNTHLVLEQVFKAMNMKIEDRKTSELPNYAHTFPYVNGGLFSGSAETPRFTKIARSYLLRAGELNWREINPDIFGSMIQAVADDEERGALGMHYTSVPNILKVLNPLFLDDLREQLHAAGGNARMLLNLRKRMSRIRVFDPACGSGNFLVIAYKEMRAIEAKINQYRKESHLASEIHKTNFRGIELRDFAAEIARLALIIAEYQCDVKYRGQKLALAEFLPLDKMNWIVCGNALRIDWLTVCPPTGTAVRLQGDDLFSTPLEQAEIDFQNEGGETYICGNPPFTGARKQTDEQKADLESVFANMTSKWKNVDYVGAWLLKAAFYNNCCKAPFAFVATNSLCQGQQVPITWSILHSMGYGIRFAYTSFKWSNLARSRAGVTVVVVGVDSDPARDRFLHSEENRRVVNHINPYLTEHLVDIVMASKQPLCTQIKMDYGVYYSKSEGLILNRDERDDLCQKGFPATLTKRFLGSSEFINGTERYCIWLDDDDLDIASEFPEVIARIGSVRQDRLDTKDVSVQKLAARPHQFRERKGDDSRKIFVPIVSSEAREYFPVGIADETIVPTNKAFYIGEAPLWCLSILSTKLHLIWIGTVCGRLEMRFSYSNTLGWNTFPIPTLTEQNKSDLTRCAQEILLAREAHFPKTIANLYDPETMPENLRRAHDHNDEVLERIYIGRRFKNDTERLEKLFELYTKTITNQSGSTKSSARNQKI